MDFVELIGQLLLRPGIADFDDFEPGTHAVICLSADPLVLRSLPVEVRQINDRLLAKLVDRVPGTTVLVELIVTHRVDQHGLTLFVRELFQPLHHLRFEIAVSNHSPREMPEPPVTMQIQDAVPTRGPHQHAFGTDDIVGFRSQSECER